MADNTGKTAKLMSAVTASPTMSMLDKINQQMPPAFNTAVSSSFAALEAERALRADWLAATCPSKMLGNSPLLGDIHSKFETYQSELNTKIHSMLEGWKQPLDSWAKTNRVITNRMVQAAYFDYSRKLREIIKPAEMAGLLGMSESIFKAHTAAMQSVAGYADSHAAQLTQIRDFASSFEVADITALTAGLFPKTVEDYLRANPLTKAEWEEAARKSYADDAAQDLAAIADVLDAPAQNRGRLIQLIGIIFFLLLAAIGQAMAPDGQISLAKVWWYFFSFCCLRISEHFPKVLQQWQSGSGHLPPLAIVVAPDGKDVPVRKTGNPNSAILHHLPVGTLIPLSREGTKKMKAVVADIDEDGEVIEIAWISRKNLKRIKMKQAYALKKALPFDSHSQSK